MEKQIIRAGTILYRADKESVLKEELKTGILVGHKCRDTTKFGKYFGNKPLFATAMIVEKKKSLSIGHFEVLEDITCYVGKYSFRYLNPQRFFNDRKLIPYVNIIPEENINHFASNMLPIIDEDFQTIIKSKNYSKDSGEVFIIPQDFIKLKLIGVYDLPDHKIVLENIIKTNYSFESNWYLNFNKE